MSIIGPPEILERAQAEARRLAHSTNWKPAFEGSVPETPLLVQRRDKADADYYIVSFRANTGVTARLRMNAHTGRYAEGIGIDKLGDVLKPFFAPDKAHRKVARALDRARKGKKKKKKSAEQLQPSDLMLPAPDPFLLWQPCAQSLSPFLPFYRFWVPGDEIYLRVDGKIHRGSLTYGAGL
jgi:hypothetical protein